MIHRINSASLELLVADVEWAVEYSYILKELLVMLGWHCYAKTHTHTRVKRKRDPNSADSPAQRRPTIHFDSIECGASIAISGVLKIEVPVPGIYCVRT